MDDEESKVRRNLVVVAVLIILAWWLDVPLEKVSNRVLGYDPPAKTFEWRVWFAATLAVLYFALRFRFSEEHHKYFLKHAEDLKARSRDLLISWLRFETSLYVRSGGRTPMPVMGTAFGTAVKASLRDIQRSHGDDTLETRLSRVFVSDAAFNVASKNNGEYGVPVYKAGQARMQFFVTSRHGEEPSHRGAEPLGFELTLLGRFIARFATHVAVAAYSKSGTALLLPWTLALLAVGLASWKTYSTW